MLKSFTYELPSSAPSVVLTSFRSTPDFSTYMRRTGLKLANLPRHTAIELNFILVIIDTWDGTTSSFGPPARKPTTSAGNSGMSR